MANIYYDKDADLELLAEQKDRRHRLRQPGARPRAQPEGQRLPGGGRPVRGEPLLGGSQEAGLTVMPVAEAAAWADVVMILVPDPVQPALYREAIAPGLKAGDTLMFAHGFNIRYYQIVPPADVDVSMIAPKSPATACASCTRRDGARRLCWPSTRTPPGRPRRWPWPMPRGSAAPGPA